MRRERAESGSPGAEPLPIRRLIYEWIAHQSARSDAAEGLAEQRQALTLAQRTLSWFVEVGGAKATWALLWPLPRSIISCISHSFMLSSLFKSWGLAHTETSGTSVERARDAAARGRAARDPRREATDWNVQEIKD